jgi:hypothetical protein
MFLDVKKCQKCRKGYTCNLELNVHDNNLSKTLQHSTKLEVTAQKCSLQLQVLPANYWPCDSVSSSLTGQSHLRCTSGVRLMMCTLIAWFFSYLGGIGHSLYLTSSPGSGMYSPSMLKPKSGVTYAFPVSVVQGHS